VPIVLVIIAVLLGLLLRSLVAPLYLIATVGLSYVAALGFATIVFVHLGGDAGLNFVIPFLLFIFAMALGEDYNILVMSRIREEALHQSSLRQALTRAIGRTGGTITSAGVILAGTFTVLGIAGGNDQARQLGFTIAFAVFLDTFFVRTLLVPAIAVLLGRANWWPSRLSRPSPAVRPAGQGQHWALAGAALALLADHLERDLDSTGATPRLVAAAARLAPEEGTTDAQRARAAARTVLRPLAKRTLAAALAEDRVGNGDPARPSPAPTTASSTGQEPPTAEETR
jgi:hypothetical protein